LRIPVKCGLRQLFYCQADYLKMAASNQVFTGFSLTHKFVRFGACFRQMTRKMNLHCDTLDTHNACQNELIHSHILLSPIIFIFVSSSNCCKKLLSINLLQLNEVNKRPFVVVLILLSGQPRQYMYCYKMTGNQQFCVDRCCFTYNISM